MQFSALQYFGLAILAFVGYSAWSRLDFYLRERKIKKQYGTDRIAVRRTELPFGLDIVQNFKLAFKRQSAPEMIRENYEEYGHTHSMKVLGNHILATREPRNVQALLATNFKDFGLGPSRYRSFKPLLGDGIFTLDGSGWEHSRALLRPQFGRNQITQLENMEEHIRTMMQCIPGDGSVVDLQALFFDLTIDTATEFLFGESCNSLEYRLKALKSGAGEVPLGTQFADAFNDAQDHTLKRIQLRDFYFLHNPKEYQAANKICHEFADKYVYKALHIGKMGISEKEKEENPKYVFLEEIAKETKDPKVLRDALLNILLAGRDTTASLLGFVFYLLVRYPEAEQKLRAAILESFGDGSDGELLTFEGLKSCKYLRWVINETLRMYPVVPFNSRTALRDTWLPLGGGPDQTKPIFIPKGMEVQYSVYAMHRREDIWGEDAQWFRPERFGETRKGGYGNFEYLPFNGGPRICLGQQYALTEASYAIVRMFQRFKRFENADLNNYIKCNATLTMCVGGKGVKVKCFTD